MCLLTPYSENPSIPHPYLQSIANYNNINNKEFIIYRKQVYPESSLKNLTLYTQYLCQKGIIRVEVGLKNPISSLINHPHKKKRFIVSKTQPYIYTTFERFSFQGKNGIVPLSTADVAYSEKVFI